MLIPVRCISCGKLIANKWEEYQKKISQGEDRGKVLDDLGLSRYCCRSIFMTHVDIISDVGKFRN